MDVLEAMAELGGVATKATLVRLTSAKRVRRAVRAGDIVRVGRGRYRTTDADQALRRAVELRGMASHLSAAQVHGWEIPKSPPLPWVTVPRNREVAAERRALVFWADLSEESGFVTAHVRTVVDCARRCAFTEALAVADSALRAGVDHELVVRAARQVRGKGARQAVRVAEHASALAANTFESVLRGLALEAGLDVVPQSGIDLGDRTVHPDVVDRDRKIVLEADSWEFHAGKEAFQRDCRRYTDLVVAGWTVLRFTWWQVMHEPDWVRACLRQIVEGPAVGANVA
jgi:very-short-patch-repair endonuclease